MHIISTLSAYDFLPAILLPTRLMSKTLVDHIFIRLKCGNNLNLTSGNILSDITDHLPVFLNLDSNSTKSKTTNRPWIRIFSEHNKALFKAKFEASRWDYLIIGETVDDMYKAYYKNILSIYDECFPLVKLSRKRAKDKKWITQSLRNCIRKKNLLYSKKIKSPNPQNVTKYNKYHNVLTSCIRQAEIMYYQNMLSDKRTATVKFWKVFGSTLNNKNSSKSYLQKLVINGEDITDHHEISNNLNRYFCEVGKVIHDSIQATDKHFTQYMKNKINEVFFLSPITESNILRELKQINPRKASGPDILSTRLINLLRTKFSQTTLYFVQQIDSRSMLPV